MFASTSEYLYFCDFPANAHARRIGADHCPIEHGFFGRKPKEYCTVGRGPLSFFLTVATIDAPGSSQRYMASEPGMKVGFPCRRTSDFIKASASAGVRVRPVLNRVRRSPQKPNSTHPPRSWIAKLPSEVWPHMGCIFSCRATDDTSARDWPKCQPLYSHAIAGRLRSAPATATAAQFTRISPALPVALPPRVIARAASPDGC